MRSAPWKSFQLWKCHLQLFKVAQPGGFLHSNKWGGGVLLEGPLIGASGGGLGSPLQELGRMLGEGRHGSSIICPSPSPSQGTLKPRWAQYWNDRQDPRPPLILSLSLPPSFSLNLYLKSLCSSGIRKTYRPNQKLPFFFLFFLIFIY